MTETDLRLSSVQPVVMALGPSGVELIGRGNSPLTEAPHTQAVESRLKATLWDISIKPSLLNYGNYRAGFAMSFSFLALSLELSDELVTWCHQTASSLFSMSPWFQFHCVTSSDSSP